MSRHLSGSYEEEEAFLFMLETQDKSVMGYCNAPALLTIE